MMTIIFSSLVVFSTADKLAESQGLKLSYKAVLCSTYMPLGSLNHCSFKNRSVLHRRGNFFRVFVVV